MAGCVSVGYMPCKVVIAHPGSRRPSQKWSISIMILNLVCDATIMTSMMYYLQRGKTGFVTYVTSGKKRDAIQRYHVLYLLKHLFYHTQDEQDCRPNHHLLPQHMWASYTSYFISFTKRWYMFDICRSTHYVRPHSNPWLAWGND